jgi:hypothetical protein
LLILNPLHPSLRGRLPLSTMSRLLRPMPSRRLSIILIRWLLAGIVRQLRSYIINPPPLHLVSTNVNFRLFSAVIPWFHPALDLAD